jgi:hypothetical protein
MLTLSSVFPCDDAQSQCCLVTQHRALSGPPDHGCLCHIIACAKSNNYILGRSRHRVHNLHAARMLRLRAELPRACIEKPFLATHFCLPVRVSNGKQPCPQLMRHRHIGPLEILECRERPNTATCNSRLYQSLIASSASTKTMLSCDMQCAAPFRAPLHPAFMALQPSLDHKIQHKVP